MYYESYFDLKATPFSISPDPRYLYLTQNHREALAHLLYGVSSNGGFVLLTGEIGAGKTTVCQCLLEQLPENTDVAYILNPKLEPWEFLAAICDELDIRCYSDEGGSLKYYIDLIHEYLLKAHSNGRNTVLMVDEAQNLSTELIEHLRLLTNLETREKKLLQIMLVGQPELRDKIALPELKQMAQRITARFHLGPLTKPEVAAYVRHRLNVAGAKKELFTKESLDQLWRYTKGVPRLINIICDRALLGAYTSKRHRVDRSMVDKAAAEVLGLKFKRSARSNIPWLRAGLAICLAVVAFLAAYNYRELSPSLLTDISEKLQAMKLPFKVDAKSVEDTKPEMPAPAAVENDTVETEAALIVSGAEAVAVVKNAPPSVAAVTALDESLNQETPDNTEVPANQLQPRVEAVAPPDEGAPARSVEGVSAEPFAFPQGLSSDALRLSAYNALFRRWDIAYTPDTGVDPCQFALGQQLICMEGQGNLPMLLQIDRPALLTLYDSTGKAFPAALIAVNGSEVILILAGELRRISVNELPRWWYGEYQIFWQKPPGYRLPLQKGSTGNAVVWLLQQLGEKLDGGNTAGLFDDSLEQKVKLFQLKSGLIPDGVVGPRTVIALNNEGGNGLPRLTGSTQE